MGELGPDKLILIALVLLLLFGARRIPEIAQSLGKGIREFKRGLNEIGSLTEPADPRAERETPGAGSREPRPLARGAAPVPRADAAVPDRSEPKRLLR